MEAEGEAHFRITGVYSEAKDVAGANTVWQPKIKEEPSEKEYTCPICSELILGEDEYEAHIELHSAQNPFKFPHLESNNSLASRYDPKHQTLQTPSQLLQFECAIIKEEVHDYDKSPPVEITMDLLASDTKCPRCNQYFDSKIRLRDHQLAEHPDHYSPYLCRHDKCNQKFYKYDAYIRHMAGHNLKHVCEYCDRVFRLRQTLQQHLRIHTGEKPYQCPQCNRSFAVKDYLNKHLRIHTGEKPYICEHGCGASFTQQTARNKHMKDHCPLRDEWTLNIQTANKPKVRATKRRKIRMELKER